MSFSIPTVPHSQAPAPHSPTTASDLPSHLSSLPASPLATLQIKSWPLSTNMTNWQFKPLRRKDTAHQYPSQTTSTWLSAAQAVWTPRPQNAGQPPRPDSWFLYFNAGVQISNFAPTSAIIALGTGYRRPNITLREDSHCTRSFREAAARNPAAQDQHILRPYSYAAAAGVQADIIRINALAEAPIPELDLSTHYSPLPLT